MAKSFTKADGVKWASWTPEEVEKMARQSLRKNAPMVGKFVEDEARKRLDAITFPDDRRNKHYRFYLSKWVLTHRVEEDEQGIVIEIGMKIGRRGQQYHGFYIETGSSTAPPHPFLRPALFENTREVETILTEPAQ